MESFGLPLRSCEANKFGGRRGGGGGFFDSSVTKILYFQEKY